MRHDPLLIRMQIEQFLAANPELAEDEIMRADMLEGCTDMHEALRECVRRIAERQTSIAALDLWIDTIKARTQRFDLSIEGMRRIIFNLMQAAGLRKIELPEATLSIRTGSPKVIVTDDTALPDGFVRIKREPDKARIKVALQDGIPVPGATLSNAEENLTIRTK